MHHKLKKKKKKKSYLFGLIFDDKKHSQKHTVLFTAFSAQPAWRAATSSRACATVAGMIEVICNDRLGKKIRVKCNPGAQQAAYMLSIAPRPTHARAHALPAHSPAPHYPPTRPPDADDTVGDLKKLLAAQTGTRAEKLRIQKWYTVYKDHITLEDYEIHDGMGLELYYN